MDMNRVDMERIKYTVFNAIAVSRLFGSEIVHVAPALDGKKRYKLLESDRAFDDYCFELMILGVVYEKIRCLDNVCHAEIGGEVTLIIFRVLPDNLLNEGEVIDNSVALAFDYEPTPDQYVMACADFRMPKFLA
jgi:hypothetical protein